MLPLPRKAHGRPSVADILADYRDRHKDTEHALAAEEVSAPQARRARSSALIRTMFSISSGVAEASFA